VTRFQTYAVKLPRAAQEYCEAVLALAAVREWCDAARRETEFVAADEPYAKK
jgi:glutathione S-transferase